MAASSFTIALLCLIAGVASKFVVPANVAEQFLNTALEAQGTSQDRIIEVLSSGSGEPQDIAQSFNSEIKATILEPNGDTFRVNLDGLKHLLGNTAELSVTKFHQNPSLSSALRPKIDEFLEYRSKDLQSWVNKNQIPLGYFVEARRRKRDTTLQISKRDIISDALTSVGGLLGGILNSTVTGVGNTVGTVVGDATSGILSPIVSAVGNLLSGITSPITSIISNLISTIGTALSSILGPLTSALSWILTPLNQTIKSALGSVISELQCALGQSILAPVVDLVNQLVDALIPCGTSCTSSTA